MAANKIMIHVKKSSQKNNLPFTTKKPSKNILK